MKRLELVLSVVATNMTVHWSNIFIYLFSSQGTCPRNETELSPQYLGCKQPNACDCAASMKVISGLKPVLHGVPNKESESVPKLGIHISPEIELKLETVRN